jgi:hypothetical protein
MIDSDTRPTGITLRLLDIDSVAAKATEQLADGTTYKTSFGPYAVAEHGDRLYVICQEGVGWEVDDDRPLELGLYADNPGYISIMPSYQLKLTPAEVRELVTDTEVDLADHVRRFGARLETNFWVWHRTLSV